MSSNWQLVLLKCKYEPWILPILLALLRILICFLPQTGYLHPDEFFQSSDIIGGQYFKSKIKPVWEFTTKKPIRCMLIPNLLNGLAFKLATVLQSHPSAYLLIITPKLVYTLVSFIIDFCLYKLCQYYSSRGLWYLPVSVIFQSSFACLACLNRTLSNTPETIIFALLLVVVCQTIKPTFRILLVTPTRRTPVNERVKTSTQLISSCLVGCLITIGTFNRPTFPCFALVPCLYWIFQSFKRNSYDKKLTIKRVIVPLLLSAASIAIPISTYDTIYYNSLTLKNQDGSSKLLLKNLLTNLVNFNFDKLYNLIKENWILTPYNFILYNTNVDNLTKYGLHLPYTHMLVNVPLLFNLLGIAFYGKLIQLLVGSGVYRLIFSTHRVYALMLLSSLTSIILLSFIPHQEFRFLLPLIVPLVYAFAFNIYTSNKLLPLWFLINLIMILFYSSVHQSGVLKASLDLDKVLKSHQSSINQKINSNNNNIINVIALRCYLVPSYLWNIPEDDDHFNFDLQDNFVEFNESLEMKLTPIITRQINSLNQTHFKDCTDEEDFGEEKPIDRQIIYVMMPKLYENKLKTYLNSHETPIQIETIKDYNFHFSYEELDMSIDYLKKHGIGRGFSTAFGFSLLRLNFEID